MNFPLLADTDHALAEKVWRMAEKNMYGKKSMGVQRSTFLIDGSGTVVKVWKKVSVDGHDEQVIEPSKNWRELLSLSRSAKRIEQGAPRKELNKVFLSRSERRQRRPIKNAVKITAFFVCIQGSKK